MSVGISIIAKTIFNTIGIITQYVVYDEIIHIINSR